MTCCTPQLQSMAWVEDKLVICTSLGYSMVNPQAAQATQLFSLPESSISQTLVQELPGYNHAVLLMVSALNACQLCAANGQEKFQLQGLANCSCMDSTCRIRWGLS